MKVDSEMKEIASDVSPEAKTETSLLRSLRNQKIFQWCLHIALCGGMIYLAEWTSTVRK